MAENLAAVAPPAMPPELELRSLRRARRTLMLQRWLFGAAILFSLLPLSSAFTFRNGRLTDGWLLAERYPWAAVGSLGVILWVVYFVRRRGLGTVV